MHNFRNTSESQDHVFIKTGYETVKVMYEDILFLEASGNYVTFVLKDKNVLSRSTFAEAINLVPEEKFVRVHRSYLVAAAKIDKIERHQITLGSKKVPISDAYSAALAAKIKKEH